MWRGRPLSEGGKLAAALALHTNRRRPGFSVGTTTLVIGASLMNFYERLIATLARPKNLMTITETWRECCHSL